MIRCLKNSVVYYKVLSMWIPITLSLLGLVLIYLEFFLPGGLIAIIGALSLVGGLAYFSTLQVSIFYKILYFTSAAAGCALVCQMAIWSIKSRKNNSFLLASDQEGYVASAIDRTLIGKQGIAQSDLKPSGHIVVDNKRYQALSEGGYIIKGTSIILIGGQGTYYSVIPK